MKCRHCQSELDLVFADLATAPPSNAYVSVDRLNSPEQYFPLRILVCETCWLVQTEDFTEADYLFDEEYAYFSSFSSSWLEHCKTYSKDIIRELKLGSDSTVSEIAANDGYLLQYFKAAGIDCYGVEPTASTASKARERGIDIVESFFGETKARELAAAGRSSDLMIANNVLAHVPDINDFVRGFATLLKPDGVATFEFPHLLQLVQHKQFDTIYHEHYSYLSLMAVRRIFEANSLTVFDVHEFPTHGGSLRVFAQRSDTGGRRATDRVGRMLQREVDAGLATASFYKGFQHHIDSIKNNFVAYLLDAKRNNINVVAYGAAAKGCTLINYAGIRSDLLPYVVDRNPHKIGKFLPGSRIPIVDENHMKTDKPDRVIVLPWNLAPEIASQLNYVKSWNGSCMRVVPQVEEL